jgi:hypothetical protein
MPSCGFPFRLQKLKSRLLILSRLPRALAVAAAEAATGAVPGHQFQSIVELIIVP